MLCTDKEPASKDLQRYVYPCLTNSLLSFIFSLGCSLISLSLSAYLCQQFSRSNPAKCSCTGLPSPAYTRQGWLMAEVISPFKTEKHPPSKCLAFVFLNSAFRGLFCHYCKQLSRRTELRGSFPQKTDVAHGYSWELSRNPSDLDCQIMNFKHDVFFKKSYS